jgi:hypothetical protein
MKTILKTRILYTVFSFFLFSGIVGFFSPLAVTGVESLSLLEKEVIQEINRSRTNPKGCASILDQWKSYFDGTLLKFPGEIPIKTIEGWNAVDEAIRFLRTIHPMPPLTLSKGMSLGARDHVKDLISSGRMGHKGSDGSQPWDRVSRYGSWKKPIGENISFGLNKAQPIVMGLIIDDGVSGRGHRKNIFNPLFHVIGVACEEQAHYKTVCVITFAGSYIEK